MIAVPPASPFLANVWTAPGLNVLAAGILLGLGAAMPIGPVNVEIARRVLRHGWGAGVALGFGAVSVDVAYAVVSAFSFIQVSEQAGIVRAIAVAGIALLCYLAYQCFRAAAQAWRTDPLAEAEIPAPAARNAYVTGVLMTLLNPMTLAFWFLVVPATGGADAGRLPMICTGVFVGTSAWVLGVSTVLHHAAHWTGARRPERRRHWLAAADVIGGATLLCFAGLAFLRLMGSLA